MSMVSLTSRVVLAAGGLLLAGCNTVQGVGRDVSSVGQTVTKAAK